MHISAIEKNNKDLILNQSEEEKVVDSVVNSASEESDDISKGANKKVPVEKDPTEETSVEAAAEEAPVEAGTEEAPAEEAPEEASEGEVLEEEVPVVAESENAPKTTDLSNWYTIRVVSGKEKFVKENITKELEFNKHLKSKINEIFVPFEKIVVIKNDKKKIKERMFFPGYILISLEMDNEVKYFIENSTSVMSFVGPKGQIPAPLRENEVKRIFGEVKRKEGIVDNVDVPFKKDDHVKVISGPFIDFNGVVEEVHKDKQKVRVTISIFGRPTPVELDFFQLEMVN